MMRKRRRRRRKKIFLLLLCVVDDDGYTLLLVLQVLCWVRLGMGHIHSLNELLVSENNQDHKVTAVSED